MKLKGFLLLSVVLCMSAMTFAQNAECDTDISIYREAFKQWEKTPTAATANPVMISAWR